jgi:2',3'-cyclic-nucleotide 2'-phosphodiesterase (5'-nucleotidase family)
VIGKNGKGFLLLAAALCCGLVLSCATARDAGPAAAPARIARLESAGVRDAAYLARLDKVTRADAARVLAEAFKLVPISPVPFAGEEGVQKVISYKSSSGAINEAFLVAGAKDAASSPDRKAIEALVNATVMELGPDGAFRPEAGLSGREFAELVAKCVYGPDRKIDFLAQAAKDGLLPELGKAAWASEPLSGERAAWLLDLVVGDGRNFKVVTVFATSDIHGNLVPYTPAGSKVKVGSVARMSRIMKDARALQPYCLYVDAGDSPYNTNLANLTKGRVSVDVLGAMGLDATVLGNHDFDFAFDVLLSNAERAKYAMLSANTYNKDGSYPRQFKPSLIKEVGGLRLAIVGVTDDESKLTTHYSNTAGIDFKDDFSSAAEAVGAVRGKSDIVICLSHLHGKNAELPLKVKGIDVEIGGGNDLAGRPDLVGSTWLINPGKHAEALNQINVNVYKGRMVGLLFSQIFVGEGYEEDPEVVAILANYQKEVDAMMGQPVGSLASSLEWSALKVRTGELPIGDMVADSQREYMEADICLQNGGGIRASLQAGPVNLNDIYGCLPFDNKVILVEAPGSTVWAALENGVSQYPATAGRFLQVSGLKYSFDASKPAGQRMLSVETPDGKPLDFAKRYKVVINDFMGGGGDGYSMLNVFNAQAPKAAEVKVLVDSRDYIRDVLRLYFEAHKTLDPKAEGRITVMNPQL